MRRLNLFLAALASTLCFAGAAHAYIGPGLGAGVIGTILGVIGAILLALFAIIFYPIKRIFKRRKVAASEAKLHNKR